MKSYKNTLLIGTATLVLTGLITRFLGFYYRIFLSSQIGAEGIGLYQMIFPIYILCMSLSSSGIQLGICRQVSKDEATDKSSLITGLTISLPISLLCSLFLYIFSDFLSTSFLNEPRCQPLLHILSLCLPIATIHNCINGYFLGKQNALIPGITQLIEQIGRIGVVFIIFTSFSAHIPNTANSLALIAVLGLLASEIIATLFSIVAFLSTSSIHLKKIKSYFHIDLRKKAKELTLLSIPISLTNISLSLVHSLEATAIPLFLGKYGLNTSEAISTYGILTAMAMPFILFPTTITCAAAKMLLPLVSKEKSKGNLTKISTLTSNTLKYCTIFGFACTLFFILTGQFIGTYFFNSKEAGDFIIILAWLCPFIFISSTLGSILNGLGLTKATFYHNLFAALLRLSFIIVLIPFIGIKGYLWGILASELLCSLLHTISVVRHLRT